MQSKTYWRTMMNSQKLSIWMRVIGVLVFPFMFSMTTLAQTGISQNATVSLVDSMGNCGGGTRNVLVRIDLSGLTGTDGESAGLNSFVLTFDISRPAGLPSGVFAYALPGTDPAMGWKFDATESDLVDATSKVTLVGWVANPSAPATEYTVAQMIFSGTVGDITLTLDPALSSLASRVVTATGDGPGPIPLATPVSPFTFTLTDDFNLTMHAGCFAWLTDEPDYDLSSPQGAIDLLDLTALVNCGAR